MVLIEVIFFAITARNMRQILSIFLVIIRKKLRIKSVKAFPTTFQLCLLSPYLVKLFTFDIIPLLLIFWDKVTTQLVSDGKNWQFCVQIKSEK